MTKIDKRKLKLEEDVVNYLDNEGDCESLNSIISYYSYVLRIFSFKYFNRFNEDYIIEGYIAIKSGLNRFDLKRGVKFRTFIERRLKGVALDMLRKEKRISDNVTYSDSMEDCIDDNPIDNGLDVKKMLKTIKVNTTPLEYDVFVDYVLNDFTYSDIASKNGITKPAVYSIYKEVIKRLKSVNSLKDCL